MMQYPCVIRPLDDADGGGYVAFFPDLPGCMSDGESPAEALENAMDALAVYAEAQADRKIDMPAPDSAAAESDDYVQSLHTQLEELQAKLAQAEQALHRAESRKMRQAFRVGTRMNIAGRSDMKQTA